MTTQVTLSPSSIKNIETKCQQCGNIFLACAKELKRGNSKFCSLSCSSKSHKKNPEPNCACAYCGSRFYRSKSKQINTRNGFSFCDRKCKENAQRLDSDNPVEAIRPKHFGKGDGSTTYRKSYIARDQLSNWACDRCGYDEIPEIIQLHHKDRNRANNITENIEKLCPTCHIAEHYNAKDGMYKHKNKG